MEKVQRRSNTFFRLGPVERSEALCFGVKRGEIQDRMDVNYWRLTPLFHHRFSHPKFPAVPLGEVVELVQYGCSSLASEKPIGVPILRMNNLQKHGWDLTDLKYIEMGEEELARYRLEDGDLLFNRTNSKELVGKCEMFTSPGDWVFASYLIRVRLNTERVLPQFVSDFLNTRSGRLQIDRLSRQIIGMTNINAEELKEILIPIPSKIARQKQFVAAMDTARTARQAKVDKAEALLTGLDSFLLSILGLHPPVKDERKVFAIQQQMLAPRFDPHFHTPAFGQLGEMLLKHGAEPLGGLVEFSSEVWRPKDHEKATFRYIEISKVSPITGEASAEEILVADAPSRARMAVRAGDLLVSLTRPHHGSIAQITKELDGCVASTGFSVLRLRLDSRVSLEYLWCVLRSKMCLDQMLQRASGGNYPAITEQELAKVLVPVPEPKIQEAIAKEARRRREEARRLHGEAENDWQKAKLLFEEQLLGSGR